MNLKDELIELIEQMPEQEISKAIVLLKKLIDEQRDEISAPAPLDPLDAFMATIVHSLTNTIYDLSLDARRKEEKVMATRLEAYRKKVLEGWDKYKDRKEIVTE